MEKSTKFEDKMDNIIKLLVVLTDRTDNIKINIDNVNIKLNILGKKIDQLKGSINDDLVTECKKMGNHIDFIENVYDNVKHPLGYICKKIKYITGNDETQYTLTNSGDENGCENGCESGCENGCESCDESCNESGNESGDESENN
tara:strand:- start:350 stop:784 length:435 start_codon:yes stop_codon:yes gene_type:complete